MDSNHTSPPQPPAATPGATAPAHFRHKPVAGLLAFLLGWAGAHWWYLGRRGGWAVLIVSLLLIGTALRAEEWYFHPAFFLLLIPAVAGFIEALVLCLMPDAKFDARYNPGHSRRSANGWAPILVAIATLALGTTFLMIGIVLMFQRIFELPS